MKHFVVGLAVLFALACGSGSEERIPGSKEEVPAATTPTAATPDVDEDDDDAGGGAKVCCKDVAFSAYFPYGRKKTAADCPGEVVDASFCKHVCCSMPVQNEDGTTTTMYDRIPTGNCASNEFETRATVDDTLCGERKHKKNE